MASSGSTSACCSAEPGTAPAAAIGDRAPRLEYRRRKVEANSLTVNQSDIAVAAESVEAVGIRSRRIGLEPHRNLFGVMVTIEREQAIEDQCSAVGARAVLRGAVERAVN